MGQHAHCNAVGPGTSSGDGYDLMSSLSQVGLGFSSSLVTGKKRSGTITGCVKP